jgi:ribosomal protein L19
MKLKKNLIYLDKKITSVKSKIINHNLLDFKLGDRVRITYLMPDSSKKGKSVSRLNSVIAFFIKKSIKKKTNTISIFVSILFHNEIVYWQFSLNSPHILSIELLFKYYN